MSVSRRVLATALLSFGLHGVAGATPVYYADVVAVAIDYNTGVSDGDSQRVYSTRNLGPLDGSVPGASAWGSVTEIANPVDDLRTVQLHAFASSDGNGAASSATATFFETLMLTSDSLPDGTPVQIFAELVESWTVTPNGPLAPCLGKAAAGLVWQNANFDYGQLSVEDGTCDQLDTNNATGLIQGIIGQELTLYFWLQATVGPFAPSAIDASHTLSMLLTPQGDFSYVAASGNAYVDVAPAAEVPVPEPTTMLLLGTGLAFGAHRVRQRKKFGQ
jgi:hypothetical protein